jgi:hypothetical protein
MDNCPGNYATFRMLGCKLSHSYDDLNTCTDIRNNMGIFFIALFDPPHLAKLGTFFQAIVFKYDSVCLQEQP